MRRKLRRLPLFFGFSWDFVPGRGECVNSPCLTNAHVQFLGCERREEGGRMQGRGMGDQGRQRGEEKERKREREKERERILRVQDQQFLVSGLSV